MKKLLNKFIEKSSVAQATIIVFGLLGIASVITAFYNPSQLIITAMCLIMVVAGLNDR